MIKINQNYLAFTTTGHARLTRQEKYGNLSSYLALRNSNALDLSVSFFEVLGKKIVRACNLWITVMDF